MCKVSCRRTCVDNARLHGSATSVLVKKDMVIDWVITPIGCIQQRQMILSYYRVR